MNNIIKTVEKFYESNNNGKFTITVDSKCYDTSVTIGEEKPKYKIYNMDTIHHSKHLKKLERTYDDIKSFDSFVAEQLKTYGSTSKYGKILKLIGMDHTGVYLRGGVKLAIGEVKLIYTK